MKQVIVIGAGASGLMAAISAARAGAFVTVLEAESRPGRKLLLTGNGKCNLTHRGSDLTAHYRSCSGAPDLEKLTGNVFRSFDTESCLDFFHRLGLPTVEKEGNVYPRSLKSGSVLQVLLNEVEKYGIKMKYSVPISGIEKDPDENVWKVSVLGWEYRCDHLILACGSPAGLKDGRSDGYGWAGKLGLEVFPPASALASMISRDSRIRMCAGDRTFGRACVSCDDPAEKSYSDRGQIQWTGYGISGIVIFNLSRYAQRWLQKKKRVTLMLDLLDEFSEEQAAGLFRPLLEGVGDGERAAIEKRLCGYLPPNVLHMIAVSLTEKKDQAAPESAAEDLALRASYAMKHVSLPISGVRGLEYSQAAAGGIALKEVNPETMEIYRCPGLYACGEIVDVDGECGGYNLQWAWSSGYLAGRSAAR